MSRTRCSNTSYPERQPLHALALRHLLRWHLTSVDAWTSSRVSRLETALQCLGLRYGVSNTTTGFRITVSGYSHKLLTLLNEVLEKVVAFEVLDDRFEVCA